MGNETTTYTLDLAAPLVQVLVASQGSTATAYLYGVARIGEDDGTWQYHLTDHPSGRPQDYSLGSVRTLAGADGSVGATRAYQPYGTPLHTAGGAASRYGFTGEEVDATGLVYLRARFYAPSLEGFTQKDPSGLGQNPYIYARSNPVHFTDPTGLCIYDADDPPYTCRVQPGDTLYRVAQRHLWIEPWQKILEWNPQFPPPDYTIHPDDLVYLCDRFSLSDFPCEPLPSPPPSPQPGDALPDPGSPINHDNATGYWEGMSRQLALIAVVSISGEEVVYDFVTKQRAKFRFEGSPELFGFFCGLGIDISAGGSGYAGFFHFPVDNGEDHWNNYEGKSIALSLGVGVPFLEEVFPGLGGSGAVSVFASIPHAGFAGIPSVDLSNPYFGASVSLGGGASKSFRVYAISTVFLNYTKTAVSPAYSSVEQMAQDIRTGAHTVPDITGGVLSGLRNFAADHLLWMYGLR